MTTPELSVIFGAGPLGRAIARNLTATGRPVRLVTRTAQPMAGVETRAADAMDPAQAISACHGATRVFQCAAPAYHHWTTAFLPLQANILEGAARAGAVLVAAENLYAYGTAGTLTEDLPLAATTRKGRARAAMTDHLFAAHRAGKVRAVVGRASDFIGPEVRVSAYGDRLWPDLLAGRPVRWLGDPDLPHSVTYLPDFAQALIMLGETPDAWGRAWHVPSPMARTPRDILMAMAMRAQVAAPQIRPLPKWLLRAVGLVQPAAGELVEMAYSWEAPFVIDDSAFRAAFGIQPTGWDAILDATLGYWRPARAA